MEMLKTGGSGVYGDGSIEQIELIPGQCTVVQCNHDIGRSFIRSLTGEEKASNCTVTYQGKPLLLAHREMARRTGLCTLDEGLYERLKVKDYLLFWAGLYEVPCPLEELLGLAGLEGKAGVRISRLSFSEKRLLRFARSILHDPGLIVWEDPEQNLDLAGCMTVRRIIASLIQQNKAVMVTCSTLEQALSISSRIFHLTASSLASIPVQEAAESNEPDEEEPSQAGGTVLPEQSLRLSRLMVKTEDKYVFLQPPHIYFAESLDGVTHLYAQEGSFSCTWTLSELEKKLQLHRFFRCHRSYIVNLDHIAELIVWSRNSYSLVLSDGKESKIPLSKGKFEELKTLIEL